MMKSFAGKLTKAQQLNDLIRYHAESRHLLYHESWEALDGIYFTKHNEKIFQLLLRYRQENNTKTTISQFLELSGMIDNAIEIVHCMLVVSERRSALASQARALRGGLIVPKTR